jgi:RNA recognition motif-containing protein
MSNKVYVGNMSYSTTSENVKELFEKFGKITSVKLITDFNTGQSKGFAFVEMESETEAENAVKALNGMEVNGRQIVVSEAREKKDRGPKERRNFKRY